MQNNKPAMEQIRKVAGIGHWCARCVQWQNKNKSAVAITPRCCVLSTCDLNKPLKTLAPTEPYGLLFYFYLLSPGARGFYYAQTSHCRARRNLIAGCRPEKLTWLLFRERARNLLIIEMFSPPHAEREVSTRVWWKRDESAPQGELAS